MVIANSVLANSDNDHEWQFYFMACLYGYAILYPAFRVAGLCFKGLLTLAVEKKKMPPTKARYLLKELSQRETNDQIAKPYSGIVLDLSAGGSEGKSGTAEDLAARFESITLSDPEGDDTSDDDAQNSYTHTDEALTDGSLSGEAHVNAAFWDGLVDLDQDWDNRSYNPTK
jgi:hypothetical protein